LESHRIDQLENRMTAQEDKLAKIETSQAVTTNELVGINGKLDKLIRMDEKMENRFQEKEACKMVRENVKSDINGIGTIANEVKEDFKEHLKYHWGKADKYVTWITGLLMAVFVVGKMANAF